MKRKRDTDEFLIAQILPGQKDMQKRIKYYVDGDRTVHKEKLERVHEELLSYGIYHHRFRLYKVPRITLSNRTYHEYTEDDHMVGMDQKPDYWLWRILFLDTCHCGADNTMGHQIFYYAPDASRSWPSIRTYCEIPPEKIKD